MALIVCKDCKKEFSSDAARCPHCGARKPATVWSVLDTWLKGILLAGCILYALASYMAHELPQLGNSPSNPERADICTPDKIEIRQATWHPYLSTTGIQVVGEIFNGCADDVGVQIKIVFRDSAGHAVAVDDDIWPASTRNIRPHDTYPFSRILERPAIPPDEPLTMSVTAVGIKQW